MRIIDRYMLRQFIQVFFICFSSLTGLYIVFDAFSNLDEFSKAVGKQGNLFAVLGPFYLYRSIYFFDRTSGVLALISAMFTVTWIQRHNELTALAAAGISTGRVIRPVLIAALCVSVGAAASREIVIPKIAQALSVDPKNLSGENGRDVQPRYDLETDILLRGKQSFAKAGRISKPNFLLPAGLDLHGKQIVAEEAYYRPSTPEHPGGYLIKQISQPAGLDQLPALKLNEKVVIYTPRDAPWLRPGECFVASNIDLDQLTSGNRSRQFCSTWQLIRGLRNSSLDYGADVRVAIHARLVQPFLDGTLLLLGLPLILSRENRNLFVAIGLCVSVVTVFMLVNLASQYLGAIYLLSPSLAAWLPLMIFAPAAAIMAEPLLR